MARLSLLVSLLASASAIQVEPKPLKLMKLRGGASVPEMVMTASTAAAGVSGVGIIAGKTDLVNQIVWLGMTKWSDDPLLGVAILGWAIGKMVAINSGETAMKLHCQMGTVVMGLAALLLSKDQGLRGAALPLIFTAAYAYIGYFAEPAEQAKVASGEAADGGALQALLALVALVVARG